MAGARALGADGAPEHERRSARGRRTSARASAACARSPDVSFAVPAGAIFALIGPNGAGKTTLFNMIAGVLRAGRRHHHASHGERIDGLPPDEVCRRGIGRTFQIVRPFPALTRARTTSPSARCCIASRRRRRRAPRARGPAAARPVRQARPARRER